MTWWLELAREVAFWYLGVAAAFFIVMMVWDILGRIKKVRDPKRFPFWTTVTITAIVSLIWGWCICAWTFIHWKDWWTWLTKPHW